MDESTLRQQLLNTIDQRYQNHAGRDLVDYIFANYLFHSIDPALIDFSYANRQELVTYLAEESHQQSLIEHCLQATRRYTYQRNQYINYSPTYEHYLQAEYRLFFQEISTVLQESASREALAEAYSGAVRRHHERLRLILSTHCATRSADDLHRHPLLQTVPGDEYSPHLQLALLQVDVARLAEPILDIGCGAGGTLVNFLAGQGLAACGVDRLAPAGPNFYRQNWFDFDYRPRAWGTILAHQSLSTHFIFNHVHHLTGAEEYARLFKTILAALKPGGAFHYVPGLPFFEPALADLPGFALTKTPLAANEWSGIGEIFYAVTITRPPTPELGR